METEWRFRSAEGWIELGNYAEAAEELHAFPSDLKSTTAWLRLWVRIYAATHMWPNVEAMCETLLRHAPDDPFAIFHQAEALHRQGRSREAFSVFQYAPLTFKQGAPYFYALARYLCATGQHSLALSCLGKAFDSDPSLRLEALDDADLQAVWCDVRDQ